MTKDRNWGGSRSNSGRKTKRKLKPGQKWRVIRYIATDAEHAEIKRRLNSPEDVLMALQSGM